MSGDDQMSRDVSARPVGRPVERPLAAGTTSPNPRTGRGGRSHQETTMRPTPLPDVIPATPNSSHPPTSSSQARLRGEQGARARVSQSQLDDLAARLSARDNAILSFVSRHRYATTTHIRALFFTSHTTQGAATRATIRVLDRLLSLRLLSRLERRIGGSIRGSAACIWHLDTVGERLTRQGYDSPRRRFPEVSLQFLAHTLAVTDTHVALVLAARQCDLTLNRVEIETEAWRTYLGPTGTTALLQPDLAVTIFTADYDDHFYLEVDRGTESLPVLLTKCRAYDAYRKCGRAQAEHGVFPRVIWIVPTAHRAERLTAAIANTPSLPKRIFTAITPDQLVSTVLDAPDPPDP